MGRCCVVRRFAVAMMCAMAVGGMGACAATTRVDDGSSSVVSMVEDCNVDSPYAADDAYVPTRWSMRQYPDYVRVDGAAVIDHDIPVGTVTYSSLDELGRAGRVEANVTAEMAREGSDRKREDMGDMRPSGWRDNEQVDIPLGDGRNYHGYFYNRSHLLAKSLGGKEDLENLITGTRMQNVGANDGSGGMAFTETLARDWLRDNPDGSVEYVATPVYLGDELVARSVFVDMRSSDGSLDLHVEVYNAANGYSINYRTGEWTRA